MVFPQIVSTIVHRLEKKVSERNQQHSSNVERKIQQPQTTVYIHIKEAGSACEQNTTR